jgi:hypothetical protein
MQSKHHAPDFSCRNKSPKNYFAVFERRSRPSGRGETAGGRGEIVVVGRCSRYACEDADLMSRSQHGRLVGGDKCRRMREPKPDGSSPESSGVFVGGHDSVLCA